MKNMWLALLVLSGCASNPPRAQASENHGFIQGTDHVWVRGPWGEITPSENVDDVVDQLCPAVMRLPGSRLKEYGQEYCGVIYSLGQGVYYASHPSPLGERQFLGPSKRKTCTVPTQIKDERGRASGFADFHGHPWFPSQMSPEDRMRKNQHWFVRIQFDANCHLQKLIPYVDEGRPGEVYERRGKAWKLVGIIKPQNKPFGIVTPVDD